MIFVFAIIGSIISRLCGARKVLILDLEKWIYAIPYGAIGWVFYNPVLGVGCYLAGVLGKKLGHGQYIHLGYKRQPFEQDEKIDPLLRFFFGRDEGGQYWRCATGLALTGIVISLLPGIIYAVKIDALYGVLLAFSGALKAVAYIIGWFIHNNINGKAKPTVIGEYLTGFFGWGAAAMVLS